ERTQIEPVFSESKTSVYNYEAVIPRKVQEIILQIFMDRDVRTEV
uniref:Lipovitellin 1, PCDZN=ZN(2+)- and CD(2+)-binding protein (Fragments) n=1 Tax=Xenopus laevis TaxID=8355 RepID=Q9PSN9_XENLA